MKTKHQINSKKRLKQISNIVSEQLPEFPLEGITRKIGMNRKTAHSYQHNFNGNFGQVRDCIILETTWLGNYEPYTKLKLNSFIYDMMIATGQEEIAKISGLLPFEVFVLESKRTICEKIMSLTRFSYSETPPEVYKPLACKKKSLQAFGLQEKRGTLGVRTI